MRIVDKKQATAALSEFADDIGKGTVVVTSKGRPIAALVPIENADIETVSVSTTRDFVDLIERSRSRQTLEGGISSKEMRQRLGLKEVASPMGRRSARAPAKKDRSKKR